MQLVLSEMVGVSHALHVEDQRHTSENPLLRWSLGLQLSCKHIRGAALLRLVRRTLVDALLLLALLRDQGRLAVDNWHDRELLLGERLVQHAERGLPARTLHVQSEDVGAFARLALDLVDHLLLDVRLDEELVELVLVRARRDLLDGREEGLRVEEAVQERDLRNLRGLLLPLVQLVQAVLQVVEPRAESARARVGQLGPGLGHTVQEDGLMRVSILSVMVSSPLMARSRLPSEPRIS